MADQDNQNRDKKTDELYEAMPATAGARYVEAVEGMSWQQMTSLLAGIVLLLATIGGWVTAVQSSGQILGIFAFNAWTTGLSLVAGVLAIYAAYATEGARRITLTVLAVAYALYAIIGLFVYSGGGKVIGLFAVNGNDVWAGALAAIVFAWLAYSRTRTE